MSESCLYEGWIRHRRHEPVAHGLSMRLFMFYVDLDELPQLFDRFGAASARGRALVEFRRSDHLGDPQRDLAETARDLVEAKLGERPLGPVRLLTNLRYLGHCFNPASFYYCFDERGEVFAVVAEVTNTPWGERHAYVLPNSRPGAGVMLGRFAKEFHVSPFMGMDHTYAWRLTRPGDRLIAHIDSERDGRRVFDATLSLARRELTREELHGALARHPLLGLRILARIYANGLTLALKRAGYFPNPSGAPLLGRARREHARRSREAPRL